MGYLFERRAGGGLGVPWTASHQASLAYQGRMPFVTVSIASAILSARRRDPGPAPWSLVLSEQ